MIKVKSIVMVISMAWLISAMIFAGGLLSEGDRNFGQLTNIDGIPYPVVDGSSQVYESMAHMDLFLREPVLAKELLLTVRFRPQETGRIRIGVRENSFWLSYPWLVLYDGRGDGNLERTETVSISLTDKIQDVDRSIDIMFLAELNSVNGEGLADQTWWELVEINAVVQRQIPTWMEFKNYARGLVSRERPI